MNPRTSDIALPETSSSIAHRIHSPRHTGQPIEMTGSLILAADQRELLPRPSGLRAIPDVPNMGALVHMDMDIRMCKTLLEKFVSFESLIYPFEVNVTLQLPQPNDFMWDFKHNFYLSIMYSQVYRYFFPFNRHNSQLFFIINEHQPEEPLLCVNIPSRIMFRSMNLETPVENIVLAAVSAYKDYVAFFRLNAKQQKISDAYKNFCYVPPVWTNKLE